MRAFIIHRSIMCSEAKTFLNSLGERNSIYLKLIFLKNSYGNSWQIQAKSRIETSEIVIVYDSNACKESENTTWEIELANKLGKLVIMFSRDDIENRNIIELKSAYDFSVEFDNCFLDSPPDLNHIMELYKIMVTSSEQLIQRRQITNGFFMTVISVIIGASGLIIKEKLLTDSTILILIAPLMIGLFMCRSWSNLIKNYGKLNTGKFKVINRIEQYFNAKIFEAEWIALGKGLRPEKYQSFTTTEQIVPKLFICLLIIVMVVIILIADWEPILNYIKTIWAYIK